MTTDRWATYYKATSGREPRELLLKALPFVASRGSALDMGAGDLTDSIFLLQQGFTVTAMDSSPAFANLAKQILEPKFDYKNASFEEFEFKTGTYDLISAQFALPFNNPKTFNLVLSKIFESLAPEGVFTAQLFGVRDEWNTADSGMTFHSKEEVEKLFESMDVVYFNEVEKEAPMASGASKHWHLFEIIAKKPSVDGKE